MGSFASSAFAIAAFSTTAFDFDTTPESTPTYSRGVAFYPTPLPNFDTNRRREDDSLLLLLL